MRHAINSRRFQYLRRRGAAIAEYRIICVVRRADGHPRAVGYTANGNGVMYDDLWTIEQARQAVADGHRLYTVDRSGERVDVELDALEDLPPCG